MGISYRIDKDRGLLALTGIGVLTDREIESYLLLIKDDPDLRLVRLELADFREAEFSVSPQSIMKIAHIVSGNLPSLLDVKRAVVVSHELQYGLARMYGQYVGLSGHEIMPFRDIAEAKEWLGLDSGGEAA
jgi:hypothetical protein